MEPAELGIGQGVFWRAFILWRTRVGHHRHRQFEIRRQPGRHRDFERIHAGRQFHQPVFQNLGALKRDQRQRLRLAPQQIDLGRFASPIGVSIRENSQALRVLVVRDRDHGLSHDRIAEPIGPFQAEDVLAPLLERDLGSNFARFGVGRQFALLDPRFADFAIHDRPRQRRERQFFARGLAFGVARFYSQFKWLVD